MSLIAATCRCGHVWMAVERTEWDQAKELAWCPTCNPHEPYPSWVTTHQAITLLERAS